MNSRSSTHAARMALLMTGILVTLPALAQTSPALEAPLPPLTPKDIQIQPPVLMLFPIIHHATIQFEDKDGTLLLTQPPMIWSGNKPHSKILWSGKLGPEPQKFTLETTSSEEDFKDNSGQVLWSQRFEEPSLTLDFDRRNHIRLLDSEGKELGFAPADNSLPHVYPAHHHAEPFYGSVTTSGGIRIETDTRRQQTTITSGTQLIWSGRRPPNDGVRFGRSPDSPILGIPSPEFPAGLTIKFEVTGETGSVTITDENHRLLKTEPVDTLHLTALCNDEQFRKSIRNWFLFSPHTAVTQVDLNAPGKIDVDFRTANGDWVRTASIHAVAKTRQVQWSSKPQIYLNTEVANFDKTGKFVGTFQDSSRPLQQE